MTGNQPNQPLQIQIEIPDTLEPIYSNVARISHSPAVLVLDYARFLPGQGMAKAHALFHPADPGSSGE